MQSCLENKKHSILSSCIQTLPPCQRSNVKCQRSVIVCLSPDPKDPVVGEGDMEIVAPALSGGGREGEREGGREREREKGKKGDDIMFN